MAVFAAFDFTLDAGYLADWKAAEEDAMHFIDDSTVVAEMVIRTTTVAEVSREAGIMWREIKYFAGKAFENNKPVLVHFDLGSYDKARRTVATLIAFLDEMYNIGQRYESELNAAGMVAGRLAAVDALRVKLLEANSEQTTYINDRRVLSSTRIEKMNFCYKYLSRVIEAAQIIYNDDPARRGRYVYFPTEGGTKESVFTGNLRPSEFRNIDIKYANDSIVTMQNTGTQPLEFFLSDDGVTPIGQVVQSAGGMLLSNTMEQLGIAAKFLTARNVGTADAGYEVAIKE